MITWHVSGASASWRHESRTAAAAALFQRVVSPLIASNIIFCCCNFVLQKTAFVLRPLHAPPGEFFRPPGGQIPGAGHDPLRVRAVPGERGVKDGLRQGCLGAGTIGSGGHEGDNWVWVSLLTASASTFTLLVIIRGGIAIRTHRIHKNLHIPAFLRRIFGPGYYYYLPP